ncbi:hypothetical protein [Escherichia phage UPWr_E1]
MLKHSLARPLAGWRQGRFATFPISHSSEWLFYCLKFFKKVVDSRSSL